MTKITIHQMLTALVNSSNTLVAAKAKKLLNNEISIKEEKKYCGSFMKAVLDGDFETAFQRADGSNQKALERLKQS